MTISSANPTKTSPAPHGDFEQTMVGPRVSSPITIKVVTTDPVMTIRIDSQLRSSARDSSAGIAKLIPTVFFELNRLGLQKAETVRVIRGDGEIPFAITCLVMNFLVKTFATVQVYCRESDSFETVSL